MADDIDYYDLGYKDYPDNHNYPTLDTHSIAEEAEYVKGWTKKAKEEYTAIPEQEPTGYNWMGDYTKNATGPNQSQDQA